MDTRLVEDIVRALLKDNDVDTQDGYCTVKEQVGKVVLPSVSIFVETGQERFRYCVELPQYLAVRARTVLL